MAYNISQASTMATEISQNTDLAVLKQQVAWDCQDYRIVWSLGIVETDLMYEKIVKVMADGMALAYKLGYSNKMLNNSIKHYLKEKLENDRYSEESPKRASR